MAEEMNKDKAEKAEKEATGTCGPIEVKLEGLENGYRVTVRGNEEFVRRQRKVAGAYVNFLRQADRAGWCLPWPMRVLLRFWSRYSGRKDPS